MSIPRLSAKSLSPHTFAEQFQRPGQPVILTDLVDPAVDWNLDYLTQALQSQTFLLRYYGNDRYQQDKRLWTSIGSGVQAKQVRFEDYATLLRSREAHAKDIYLAKCSIAQTPLAQAPILEAIHTQLHQLGLTTPVSDVNLWIGPSGHIECLHYDPTDGFLMQLHGAKRIVLFPPSQLANLYPYPITTHLRHGLKLRCWFSQVYPDHPDFEAFPRVAHALPHKHDIVLNPGEALYIPAGWWHEVTALGDDMVCSINRFWGVHPLNRRLLSWSRWRSLLGSTCAIPVTVWRLLRGIIQGKGAATWAAIRQML
jgi:hypothetical protein